MGRSKLPEQVKKLRGTSRKDREVDSSSFDTEIVKTLEEVNAPTHLSPAAKKIYKEVVQRLFAMKMLLPVDEYALSLYASAMATAIKVQKELDKEGYLITVKDENGDLCKVMVNPMVKVLKDAVNTANAIGSQFGWSPVSRIRLAAMASGKDKDKDDFEDSINGK